MRILDLAMSADWAMTESAARTLLEVAAREVDMKPEALEAYRAKALEKTERATVRDGVAILQVEGPLFKKANLMTEFCGATSYALLRRDLQAALDDDNVKAILLNVDSPGGEASGTAELAAAIYEARDKKRIVAYAGDLAASAGYWIASAAGEFVIGSAAQLGSIGVRAALQDTSARDAARGIKSVEFVSSQSPYKATDLGSEEGRGRVQARVDALADVFVDAVAKQRGTTRDEVLDRFGKGDVLVGKAALAAGMADGFGTFESVLKALAEGTKTLATGGHASAHSGISHTQESPDMKTEAELAAEAAALAEATAKAEAEAKAKAEADAKAAADLQAAASARVSGIYAATPKGFEGMRDEAIRSGSTVEAFSALIKATQEAHAVEHAKNIALDTAANAGLAPSGGAERATGDDAAVKAILSSFKLATGE